MAIRERVWAVWSALWGNPAGGAGVPWHLPRDTHSGAPVVTPQTVLALTGVYRACNLLADAASSAPVYLYSRPQNGGRIVDTTSAGARALATLAHADAELFAFSTALLGNGFLRIVRDGNGAPFELRAIAPWRVTLEVEAVVGRLWYRLCTDPSTGDREELLPETDVVHAKYRSTSSRLVGTSPIASCAPSFALALQSRDVQRALFSNLATPGGVLVAPGKIDQAIARQLQVEWEQNFSGRGTGKVAVLSNGLDYKSIVWKAADQQLLEQVQASTQDIARAYGIPKQFLEDGTQQTYASASEGTRALYSLALRGFCVRLADALARKLLTRNERAAGASVEFDVSSMLVLPGTEMADFLSKLANAGICTANELRNQYLNLPDVPGGDVLRAPSSSVPADQLLSGAKAWQPGRRYERGALCCKDGGLWRAAFDTTDEPQHSSAQWDALLWGASATTEALQ